MRPAGEHGRTATKLLVASPPDNSKARLAPVVAPTHDPAFHEYAAVAYRACAAEKPNPDARAG